ncbi:hypothetical protein FQA39_LY02313 [Lamprigera yunnana]|nr:hypothetical protein FQA39_LY02313 [Lamprigera yunnana]
MCLLLIIFNNESSDSEDLIECENIETDKYEETDILESDKQEETTINEDITTEPTTKRTKDTMEPNEPNINKSPIDLEGAIQFLKEDFVLVSFNEGTKKQTLKRFVGKIGELKNDKKVLIDFLRNYKGHKDR